MDRAKMEEAIRLFVDGVEERFPGDDLEATPSRVARAWFEDLLSGYHTNPDEEMSWTGAPEGTGPVLLQNVSFTSICVHHLLPFVGRAHVVYLPDSRLAGLSKIGRVVEAHSRRLQIQERLTSEILGTLERTLRPHGVLILLEADHTCMTLRGVRKQGSRLVTLSVSGVYETDPSARKEVLGLLAQGRDGPSRATR